MALSKRCSEQMLFAVIYILNLHGSVFMFKSYSIPLLGVRAGMCDIEGRD